MDRTTHELTWSLGDLIRKARTERGWKQEDLADALGVSRPLVSKWERNHAQPDLFEFAAIVRATTSPWLAAEGMELALTQGGRSSGWVTAADVRFASAAA